ncbi:MAG: ABC transporter permease subunit [Clostridia bacterium]|nr:ABC transporter permease subunit [Clostridia bacterium]
MGAIFRREIKSYFSSPVGYVCVAAIAAIYGFFYYQVMLAGSSAYVSSVYSSVYLFSMMIIPVITMKSMAEDMKNKTDQALLTAPVGVTSIVMGKFLAAFCVFIIASTVGLIPAAVLEFFANPPWGIIFGNYIATLLYGGAMISIGVFISSLTVSQVIAAVATFLVSIGLMYLDSFAANVQNSVISSVIGFISFTSKYDVFTSGIFSVSSCVFFVSVMAAFVFLTARRLESRRWN